MKIIALLLSMIVLVLTVIPCCPLEEKKAYDIQKVTSTGSQKTAHDEADSCHDCSPFYTCGSCAGFVFELAAVIKRDLNIEPILHNSLYQEFGLPLIARSIWQPPKINL